MIRIRCLELLKPLHETLSDNNYSYFIACNHLLENQKICATEQESTMQKIFTSSLLLLFLSQIEMNGQVNVLTQHNDLSRTGANLKETTLNTNSVVPYSFGKL